MLSTHQQQAILDSIDLIGIHQTLTIYNDAFDQILKTFNARGVFESHVLDPVIHPTSWVESELLTCAEILHYTTQFLCASEPERKRMRDAAKELV